MEVPERGVLEEDAGEGFKIFSNMGHRGRRASSSKPLWDGDARASSSKPLWDGDARAGCLGGRRWGLRFFQT